MYATGHLISQLLPGSTQTIPRPSPKVAPRVEVTCKAKVKGLYLQPLLCAKETAYQYVLVHAFRAQLMLEDFAMPGDVGL